MIAKNTNNEAPIFRFLNKHKWRIILPMIFALFYFALPRYNYYPVAVQQGLFIKSSILGQNELKQETTNIKNKIHSDNFLKDLILKYDLYKTERSNNVEEKLLIEKLRNAIGVSFPEWDFEDGVQANVWISFRKENSQHIVGISTDVTAQFENVESFQVIKYVSKPYDANPWRNYVFIGALMQGFVMLVIPLILFWEIPNMFYSPRTKETVFEPLKSDWQRELYEARLRNQTWKAFEINIRYSFAYFSAMIQKSSIGDLIEFVRKIAR